MSEIIPFPEIPEKPFDPAAWLTEARGLGYRVNLVDLGDWDMPQVFFEAPAGSEPGDHGHLWAKLDKKTLRSYMFGRFLDGEKSVCQIIAIQPEPNPYAE